MPGCTAGAGWWQVGSRGAGERVGSAPADNHFLGVDLLVQLEQCAVVGDVNGHLRRRPRSNVSATMGPSPVPVYQWGRPSAAPEDGVHDQARAPDLQILGEGSRMMIVAR